MSVPDDRRTIAERAPAEATFEAVAVVEGSKRAVRGARLVIAAAMLVVIAAAGSNLLGIGGDEARVGFAASPSPSSPAATITSPSPNLEDPRIDPGRYAITLPGLRIHLTMPAGWSSARGATVLYKPEGGLRYPDTSGPSLAVHTVAGIAADLCRGGRHFLAIGPTVEDLATALVNLEGLERSGPTEVLLGGYPARRFGLSLAARLAARCGGPEGRWLWENADGSHFGILFGGTATVDVVDVDGNRLVITGTERGASREDLAQLDAMIASIEIERGFFPDGEIAPSDRYTLTVDGVPFSFSVPGSLGIMGWAPGPIEELSNREGFWSGSLLLSKSVGGGQGAEAVVYWTRYPDGRYADPCANLPGPPTDPLAADLAAADLAAAVSTASGIDLVSGPSDVVVGGRAAILVALVVREDVGCDPGFFFSWPGECWGPCWMSTDVGTTIRVWIVDVDGTLLFIAGETRKNAGRELEQEIEQIVGSIRFE